MVPTLGESVTEATVSSWFKTVGDTVAQDEMLCELETDKVSVEVPAPAAGVLTSILAPEGTTVQASAKLAVIGGAQRSALQRRRSGHSETNRTRCKQRHRRRPIREKGDGRGTPEPRSGHRNRTRWTHYER